MSTGLRDTDHEFIEYYVSEDDWESAREALALLVASREKESYRNGYRSGWTAGSKKWRNPELPSRKASIEKQKAWVDKRIADIKARGDTPE